MLEPRAPEHEIAMAAHACVGRVRSFLGGQGKCMPSAMLEQQLDELAYKLQARPVARGVSLSGRIARMHDEQWWRRGLRTSLLRENETDEHAQGRIRRRGACYVSDHAVQRKTERAAINRRTLESLEVVNEDGLALNLQEVSDGSVSNPRLRRSELMVRCRGFEEVAQFMGHEAVFLTVTCPSRFHRFDGQGKPNAKWDGSTPRDAQRYLCDVWAKTRAEWKRQGFAPYGFRVAEPHHDGCPHWHILLFAPPQHVGWFVARRLVAGREDAGAGLVGVAGAYAMEDSPDEPGAIRHRFTCERIDPAKGSATGYIAKYIAKNIDGEKEDGSGVGLDYASGTRAIDAAKRVRIWASTWGIRQFQQIGGPSVTVWRELRRLGKDGQPLQLELFEHPRSAADRALWGLFWLFLGGPDTPKSLHTLKPAYRAQEGRYGDLGGRVYGVIGRDDENGVELPLITRLHDWKVQGAGVAARTAEAAEWNIVRGAMLKLGLQPWADVGSLTSRVGEAGAPWTGVNNCTADVPAVDDDEAEALRADFLRGQGGATFEGFPHERPSQDRPDHDHRHDREQPDPARHRVCSEDAGKLHPRA